ncbi:MAG TPA: hypothetical protein VIH83_02395 [Candidatus Bathyarchaeia archaeon]
MSNPSWRRVFGMSARTLVFSQLLLEAIDDSLSILGDEPKKALYQYLATMHSLQREEIPDRLEEFSAGLKRALGGASSVIQRIILRKLFQKLGSTFRESQDSEFPDYIRDARRRFDSAKQRHNLPDDSMEYVRSKKSQLSG